jgi:hypothetical protein
MEFVNADKVYRKSGRSPTTAFPSIDNKSTGDRFDTIPLLP